MGQEDNDEAQLESVINILSNVYKSQCQDGISDNGNLTVINNAILNVKTAVSWIKSHMPAQ